MPLGALWRRTGAILHVECKPDVCWVSGRTRSVAALYFVLRR